MEAMKIQIGPLAFDHADYDQHGDVLYLHVGPPSPAKAKKPRRGTFFDSLPAATASLD
jgi:hypothetical protein